MKLIASIFIILLTSPLLATLIPSKVEKIQQSIDTQIREGYNVGASVAIIDQDEVQFINRGVMSKKSNQFTTDHTLYEIGSISKVFTAIITASLQLEGVLSIHDKVSKWVTELEGTSVGEVTLLELSTHRSGLPRLPENLKSSNPADPYADYTEAMLLDFLTHYRVALHPTPFSWENYSNLGVGLLGYALTRATGLSYEALLLKYVTGPLKMSDTLVTLNASQLARFAQGYTSILETQSGWNLSVLVGAGGIRSTTSDLVKFVKANLQPDDSLLGRALILSHEVQAKGKDGTIALGWELLEKGDATLYTHTGATGGYRAGLAFAIKEQKGFVWLTNSANSLQCIGSTLFDISCTPSWGFSLTEKQATSYVGAYQNSDWGLIFKISAFKNRLLYEVVGQEKGTLNATSSTEFNVGGIAFFRFKSSDDKVLGFEFSQNGNNGFFEKID